MKTLGSFVEAANLSGNPEGVGIGFKVHLPRRTLPDPTEAAENLQNGSTTWSKGLYPVSVEVWLRRLKNVPSPKTHSNARSIQIRNGAEYVMRRRRERCVQR